VESGRWSARGDEDVHHFEQAAKQVVSRELKIAARVKGSQGEVWSEVGNVQEKLAANIGKSVADPASLSSLQLTLENIDVQEQIEALVMEMTDALDTLKNVIGVMYVINGEIAGGDLYCDGKLFDQCWSRLIESYAIEALSLKDKFSNQSPPSVNTISAWFEATSRGKQSKEEINKNTTVKTIESDSAYRFETLNSRDDNQRVHVNMIPK
jgi:hypothetical protein